MPHTEEDTTPRFKVVPSDGIPYLGPGLHWCVVSSTDRGNYHAKGFRTKERADAWCELMAHPKTGGRTSCDLCDRPARHQMYQYGSDFKFCCFHHVEGGAPPADWHDDCLAAWNTLFPEKCYFLKRDGRVIDIPRDQLSGVIAELKDAL